MWMLLVDFGNFMTLSQVSIRLVLSYISKLRRFQSDLTINSSLDREEESAY